MNFSAGGGLTVEAGVTTNQTFDPLARGTSGTSTFTNNGSGTLTFGWFNDPNGQTWTPAFDGSGDITVTNGIRQRLNSSNVSVIKNGSGTLTILSGVTTAPTSAVGWYTGSTTINAGVLQLGNQWALGGGTGDIRFGGGTLRYSGSNAVDYSARIKSSSAAISIDTAGRTVTFGTSLPSTNTGGLTKLGAGTLTLSASNAFSGDTLVSSGTLALGDANALFGSTFDTASAGVLSLGSLSAATFGGLKNSGTFTLTNSGSAFDLSVGGGNVSSTFAGRLDGLGSLTKVGSGTLALTAANAYNGTTSVNAGVLQIGGNGVAGGLAASSAITGSSGATLVFARTDDYGGAFANAISGGLGVRLNSGTLALSASNSYTGNTTVNAGVLQIGSNGAAGGLAAASAISGSSGATLAFARTDDYGGAFANAISGGLGVRLASGSLTLSTSNAYTGGTRIDGGTLILSNTFAAGTGPVQLAGGGLSLGYVSSTSTYRFSGINVAAGNSGTLTLAGSGSAADMTYATGTISVGGALTVQRPTGGAGNTTFTSDLVGSGTLTVENTNGGVAPGGGGNARALFSSQSSTFDGSVIVRNGGNFVFTMPNPTLASADINAGGFLTVLDAKTYTITTLSGSGTVIRNGGSAVASLVVQGGTFSGEIQQATAPGGSFSSTAPVALTKTSAGTLVLSGSSNYAGGSTITAGTLRVRHANALGSSTAALAVNGGTLDLDGTSISVGALSGSAGAVITTGNTAGTATLTSAVASGTSVFGGVIQDNGSGVVALTKSGAGVLALNASNAYTGATSVNAGTLAFDRVAALNSSSGVNVAAGAILDYTGAAGTLSRNVTVSSSGTGTIRNSGGQALTLSGTLTKDGRVLRLTGGTFDVTGQIVGASGGSDLLVDGTSTVTLSSANTYNGPTFVNQASTLIVGINDAIPNNSTVTLGDATTAGTLTLGTFTNAIGGLAFGVGGGTVRMAANQTASPQLSSTSALVLGSNASLDLAGMQTSAGNYRLISSTGITGTFGSVTALDSNYVLRYGTVNANEVSAQRKAEFGTVAATPAAATIIVGGSTSIGYTVANLAPADGSTLSFTSSNGANVAGASNGTAIAGGTSASISGLFFTGAGVGLNQTGSFTLTDPDAIGSPANGSVSVNVLNHSLASFASTDTATKTLNFGTYDAGSWSGGDGGNGTLAYSVFNIASLGFSNAETAGLNLYDWAFASGDDVFSVGFSSFANLASGSSTGLFATVLSPGGLAEGSYSGTYTLKFRDQQDLSGATNTRNLSLTMNVIVVPEPGAIALAAVGIAAAAWARRRK